MWLQISLVVVHPPDPSCGTRVHGRNSLTLHMSPLSLSIIILLSFSYVFFVPLLAECPSVLLSGVLSSLAFIFTGFLF